MKDKPKYPDLTREKLKEVMKEIMASQQEPTIVIYRGCKTYGAVKITGIDMNLCEDPTCKSCTQFAQAVDKEMKAIVKGLNDQIPKDNI